VALGALTLGGAATVAGGTVAARGVVRDRDQKKRFTLDAPVRRG
jgi:hypothetical protein